MGLRSRKPGDAGEAARVRKIDAEGQLLGKADAPLQKMQNNTEAFNILWRDFLFKLTCGLVAYSLVGAFAHRDDADHFPLDVLSAIYYIASALWQNGITNSNYSMFGFFGNRFFCASLALLLSQGLFIMYHHNERDGDLSHHFFPTGVIHMPMVFMLLAYMRNNVSEIKESRGVLHDLQDKLQNTK